MATSDNIKEAEVKYNLSLPLLKSSAPFWIVILGFKCQKLNEKQPDMYKWKKPINDAWDLSCYINIYIY